MITFDLEVDEESTRPDAERLIWRIHMAADVSENFVAPINVLAKFGLFFVHTLPPIDRSSGRQNMNALMDNIKYRDWLP